MNKTDVSVCIPTYRQTNSLRRLLNSIFMQSFDDYEIIITDDTPDDSVEHVVKEFQQNKKIRYIRNSVRRGSPENWNEAVRLASGKYIKLMHHDDWFKEKESLAKYVKLLDDNPHADFAFSSCSAYAPDSRHLFEHAPSQKDISNLECNPNFLYPNNFIGSPSVTIFRRKANILFDNRLKWVVDIDFYIRILLKNNTFVYWQEPLVCITTGGENQVTYEVIKDKKLQVFEWLYLYGKLNRGIVPKLSNAKFIWNLFEKYHINSYKDILETGLTPPIPLLVIILVNLRKLLHYKHA